MTEDFNTRHLVEIDYSWFAQEFDRLNQEETHSPEEQERLKWLKLTRQLSKLQAMQKVFGHLKDSRVVPRLRLIYRGLVMRKWFLATRHHKWIRFAKKLLHDQRISEYKDHRVKVKEVRATQTAKYIFSLPQCVPDFSRVVTTLTVEPLKTLRKEEIPVHEEIYVPPKFRMSWVIIFVLCGIVGFALGLLKCKGNYQYMVDFIKAQEAAKRNVVELVGPYEYLNSK